MRFNLKEERTKNLLKRLKKLEKKHFFKMRNKIVIIDQL